MGVFYVITGYFVIALIIYLIGYSYICYKYKKLNPIMYFSYYMMDEKDIMLILSLIWIVSIPGIFLVIIIKCILKLIRKCFKIEE